MVLKGKGGDGTVEKARDTEAASPLRLKGRAEEGEGLKNLLTLWREKVFALLVQGRLAQMQHQTELQETQARVSQPCILDVGASVSVDLAALVAY